MKGQIVQHTLHPGQGVAEVFLTLNGCRRPTCKSSRAICYVHFGCGEPSLHDKDFKAICLDPELVEHYTESCTYTEESPIAFPCTVSGTVNQVRMTFFHRLMSGGDGAERGSLESTSVDFHNGELIVTGQVVHKPNSGVSGDGAGNLTITVIDGGGTVTGFQRQVCYHGTVSP